MPNLAISMEHKPEESKRGHLQEMSPLVMCEIGRKRIPHAISNLI